MAILYVAVGSLRAGAVRPSLLTGLRKLNWPIDYAFEGIWEGAASCWPRTALVPAGGAGRRSRHSRRHGRRLSSSRLEAVVSTGFCGALDPALQESQIVSCY